MADKIGSSAITTLIVSGLFAILGTIGGGVVKGYWDVKLAERKFTSDLVLKALESDSAPERLESLKLLVDTNLIKEPDIREGVHGYTVQKQQNPETIPQVKPAAFQTIEPPIITNARIYLLSGRADTGQLFDAMKGELAKAGYAVLGAKSLSDPGRPDSPEVRYFNATDKDQAERIAEYMKAKLNAAAMPAKFYSDTSAKPGYIEIWLGR